MEATVHPAPVIEGRRPSPQAGGGGGWGNLAPTDGAAPRAKHSSPSPASTGIWVALASISMTFAAFTSALIVRQGSATDWRHLVLPPILYFNTAVLLASSIALEVGRRRVKDYMSGPRIPGAQPMKWLYVSLLLGVLFVGGQYLAWLQLRSRGLYLSTNPNSSFFYVLTAMHLLHVLGGLGGMARVIRRLHHLALRRSTLDATARYWHFIDVLWAYLLVLLWMKL